MPADDIINPEEMKGQLETELRELLALDTATRTEQAPVDLDQARQGRLSRIDAMQQRAMAQETARRRVRRIAQIEAALARLASGDFGYCMVCDEAINIRRLRHDPAIAFCLDHAH
jgi:DnaK suppressor protein